MSNVSSKAKKIYIGFDVSEKSIETFAVCGTETSKGFCKIENSHEAIKEFLSMFTKPDRVCVVMETGTHSLWMSDFIQKLGFEVIVAHARDLALIYGADKKNDQLDAEKLARLAQADRKLLHPITHMTMDRQRDLMVIKARDLAVRQRVQIIHTVRGLLRACGQKRIEAEFTTETIKKCCSRLPDDIKPVIAPLLKQICYLDLTIKEYDRQVRKLCKKYPATNIVRQIAGVGDLISLTFVLIVGDPNRFKNPARLCAYLGLVPKQDQSGESDKQLGITKSGSNLGRKLLIQAAHYVLGPFGPDCDLRKFGMRIQSRGGKIAKKKSCVAVARKLAAVMLVLWKHPDKAYCPNLKKSKKMVAAA